MNETNLLRDAARAALLLGVGGALFLGAFGGLGFFLTDRAFHGESAALSAASAPPREGKIPVKKASRDGTSN